jgi:hypothetical protein
MAIKKFDPETLKRLQSGPSSLPSGPTQPENGATTPTPERLREAVKEANDPRRIVTLRPGYYSN